MSKCSRNNTGIYIVLIGIFVLPLISLLTTGMPFVHDGQDHVARISNFYQSLSEGNITPRWAGNLNWGYGHPILMFLYPLPSYVASFFHFIGFSFVDSTKLIFGVAYILSAYTMYLWMTSAYGKRAGIIGSLLYTFAPYRFVDLYVRGAIGEHTAFIFPPLVLYFLQKLAQLNNSVRRSFGKTQDKQASGVKYAIGTSLSIAGLILSHNAISLMFLPVIGAYILYLYFYETKRSPNYILLTAYSVLFGFTLSAFFWVPALLEGKYTLRDIVTADGVVNSFVPWTWFFYSPWIYGGGNQFSKALGIPQWIGVSASLYAVMKSTHDKKKILLFFGLIMLFLSLFIQTEWSASIWQTFTLLQKFQFSWRFLSLSVFISAVLGGIGIAFVFQMAKKTVNILTIIFCVLLIILTIHMWKPRSYQVRPETFYSGMYPGTTDTGESSPIWSVRFMEHVPKSAIKVIDGDADIIQTTRSTTIHEYMIKARTKTLLLENTLYFPGWNIYIDGKLTDKEFQNPNYRGLMTFYVDQGQHLVKVIFENTRLRSIANAVSLISIAIIGLICIQHLWRKM